MDKKTAYVILKWWEEVRESNDRDGCSIFNHAGTNKWAYLEKPEFVTEAEGVLHGK